MHDRENWKYQQNVKGKYFWFWHSTLSLFKELVGPEFFNTYIPRIFWVAVRIENLCVAKMNYIPLINKNVSINSKFDVYIYNM